MSPETVCWLVLAATAAIATGGYALSCWWWPWAACMRCKGAGKLTRSDGRVWRPCPRCKASGRRVRVGRRVYHRVKGSEGPTWN